MPTLLALAGAELPERPLDGVDLSPVILRQESLAARPRFWASLSNSGGRSEAMRDGAWKLVVNHPKATPGTFKNEVEELYNLESDPSESRDLAKPHPEKSAALLRQLKAWHAETQETATPQPGGWLD